MEFLKIEISQILYYIFLTRQPLLRPLLCFLRTDIGTFFQDHSRVIGYPVYAPIMESIP